VGLRLILISQVQWVKVKGKEDVSLFWKTH
jgi:hypothetical protein